MFPMYDDFKKDLVEFTQKVAIIRNFLEDIDKNKMSQDEYQAYLDLTGRIDGVMGFAKIMLQDPNSEKDEKAKKEMEMQMLKAWATYHKEFDELLRQGSVLVGAINANSEEDSREAFRKRLNSSSLRLMFHVDDNVRMLTSDIEYMASKSHADKLRSVIKQFVEHKGEYINKLNSIKETFPFASYDAMMTELENEKAEMAGIEKEYASYGGAEKMAETDANYKKRVVEAKKSVAFASAAVATILDDIEGFKKCMVNRRDEIAEEEKKYNDSATAKRNELQAKIDNNNKELEEISKERELNDQEYNILSTEISEIKNKVENLRAEIFATEKTKASNKALKGLRSAMLADLKKDLEISKLREEYTDKLAELGYSANNTDLFENGKELSKLSQDEINKLDAEEKVKVEKSVKLFKECDVIIKECAIKYGKIFGLKKDELETFATKPENPYDLIVAMTAKRAEIKSRVEAICDEKKTPELHNLYLTWESANQLEDKLFYKKEQLDKNRSHNHGIEKRTYDANNRIAKLTKELNKPVEKFSARGLEEALKDTPEAIAKREAALEEKRKLVTERTAAYEKILKESEAFAIKYANLTSRQNTCAAKIKTLQAKVDAFNEFAKSYRDFVSNAKEVAELTKVDGLGKANVALEKHVLEKISEEVKVFIDHKEAGMKPGHKNSKEYTAMIDAIQKIADTKGELINNDPVNNRNDLVAMHNLAKAYIDAKNAEFFVANSNMRKVRLDFAYRVMHYAEDKIVKLDRLSVLDKELNKLANSVDPKSVITDSRNAFIYSNVVKPLNDANKLGEKAEKNGDVAENKANKDQKDINNYIRI